MTCNFTMHITQSFGIQSTTRRKRQVGAGRAGGDGKQPGRSWVKHRSPTRAYYGYELQCRAPARRDRGRRTGVPLAGRPARPARPTSFLADQLQTSTETRATIRNRERRRLALALGHKIQPRHNAAHPADHGIAANRILRAQTAARRASQVTTATTVPSLGRCADRLADVLGDQPPN